MNIFEAIEQDEARLRIDIKAALVWRMPPESTEAEMRRGNLNTILDLMAKKFEEEIRITLLDRIKVPEGIVTDLQG